MHLTRGATTLLAAIAAAIYASCEAVENIDLVEYCQSYTSKYLNDKKQGSAREVSAGAFLWKFQKKRNLQSMLYGLTEIKSVTPSSTSAADESGGENSEVKEETKTKFGVTITLADKYKSRTVLDFEFTIECTKPSDAAKTTGKITACKYTGSKPATKDVGFEKTKKVTDYGKHYCAKCNADKLPTIQEMHLAPNGACDTE